MEKAYKHVSERTSTGDYAVSGLFCGLQAGVMMAAVIVILAWLQVRDLVTWVIFQPGRLYNRFWVWQGTWRYPPSLACFMPLAVM